MTVANPDASAKAPWTMTIVGFLAAWADVRAGCRPATVGTATWCFGDWACAALMAPAPAIGVRQATRRHRAIPRTRVVGRAVREVITGPPLLRGRSRAC